MDIPVELKQVQLKGIARYFHTITHGLDAFVGCLPEENGADCVSNCSRCRDRGRDNCDDFPVHNKILLKAYVKAKEQNHQEKFLLTFPDTMSILDIVSGRQFRKLRESIGYSQARLAREMGITDRTITRWENDEFPIPKMAELALQFIVEKSGKEKSNA